MSIEDITSRKSVAAFLERNNWWPVQAVTFGATGYVLVVERDSERRALKVARDKASVSKLSTEHRLLRHLNNTQLRPYVPEVGEWLEEVGGFIMECLQYPEREGKRSETWILSLARALRMMHGIEINPINGIPDDRPDISRTVSKRLAEKFGIVLEGDEYWKSLPEEYRSKLEIVRGHYGTYSALIPDAERAIKNARPALTHGDLAGDNIMSKADGTPVFVDWGEARISTGILDIAELLTYVDWSGEETELFLKEYFVSRESFEEALPCIQVLRELYRYLACVGSLWWLTRPGDEGLDAVGRAFFEKVVVTL